MTAILKRPVIALILIACAVVLIVTGHAAQARDTGQVRTELFTPIIKASNGLPDDKCTELLVMTCLSATTRDIASPNYGKPNPHSKLACCDKNGYCYVAIIGLAKAEPALVTVIPMLRDRVIKTGQRDKCLTSNVTYAKNLVEMTLR